MAGKETGIFNSAREFMSKMKGHMNEGNRARNTAIGAGVMAGAGGAYGVTSDDRPVSGAIAGTLLGSLTGAGIGYGVSRGLESYAARVAAKEPPPHDYMI